MTRARALLPAAAALLSLALISASVAAQDSQGVADLAWTVGDTWTWEQAFWPSNVRGRSTVLTSFTLHSSFTPARP